MNHFIFLQSITASEFEAGKVIYQRLIDNPSFNDFAYPPKDIAYFEELVEYIDKMTGGIPSDDKVVLYIDIHSCEETFTFKDINSSDKTSYTEYKEWNELGGILHMLYKRFQKNATFIFVSCYSASYFSSLKEPHIHIIAGDGEVNTMQAGHQLFTFYDEFCKDGNVERAYLAMMKEHPITKGPATNNKYRAVLKLY